MPQITFRRLWSFKKLSDDVKITIFLDDYYMCFAHKSEYCIENGHWSCLIDMVGTSRLPIDIENVAWFFKHHFETNMKSEQGSFLPTYGFVIALVITIVFTSASPTYRLVNTSVITSVLIIVKVNISQTNLNLQYRCIYIFLSWSTYEIWSALVKSGKHLRNL